LLYSSGKTAAAATITLFGEARKGHAINRRHTMAWIYLLAASVVEIGRSIGLKFTQRFTRLAPFILVGVGIVATFVNGGLKLTRFCSDRRLQSDPPFCRSMPLGQAA
jgi:hypothetical protein